MKISDDQNTVEHEGVKGVFVEGEIPTSIYECSLCCFLYGKCPFLCCSNRRKDGKDGYFKKMEEADKKLYWKQWQDNECVGDHYNNVIITDGEMREQVELQKEEKYNGEFSVFEPWFMTEEEFNKLPEFEGY